MEKEKLFDLFNEENIEGIKNLLSEIFDTMLEELDNIDISCLSDEFVEALEEYQENEEA